MGDSPTYGLRIPSELKLWLTTLHKKSGAKGTELAACLLSLAKAACGDDVPDYPFEIDVTIRLKNSRNFGTCRKTPEKEELLLLVAEDRPVGGYGSRESLSDRIERLRQEVLAMERASLTSGDSAPGRTRKPKAG